MSFGFLGAIPSLSVRARGLTVRHHPDAVAIAGAIPVALIKDTYYNGSIFPLHGKDGGSTPSASISTHSIIGLMHSPYTGKSPGSNPGGCMTSKPKMGIQIPLGLYI